MAVTTNDAQRAVNDRRASPVPDRPGLSFKVAIRLHHDGSWSMMSGPVELRPLTNDGIAAAATACADTQARSMLRHRFGVDGTAQERRDALHQALLGPWSYAVIPFAVYANVGDRRRSLPRPVGIRYLEPTTSGSVTCGGWIGERYRRLGYGAAALHAAVGLVHAAGMAARVVTGTLEANVAAQANLTKVGFVFQGNDPIHPEMGLWSHDPDRGSPVPEWSLTSTW